MLGKREEEIVINKVRGVMAALAVKNGSGYMVARGGRGLLTRT